MTFEDYKGKILEHYGSIKNDSNHQLNRFCNNITPGKIKSASKIILETQNSKQDIHTLSSYFKIPINRDFLKFLDSVDADKLIPVKQFLNQITKEPREEVVEFSSWLLNFNPRPYSKFRKNKGKIIDPPEGESGGGFPPKPRIPWKKIVITVSFISSFAVILYFVIDRQRKECMIWSEDHYELVECGKTSSLDIALNKDLLENFRKIEPDTTMTFFKDGKALFWYDKTVGIEFFTMPGTHPTNGKTLKPVSQTIVRKYIYGEE
ncbi:hypothetical protein [Aquimarina sp. AU58]|uniref:hypothetical protein n=1 Tax=Aquimarina sp. AU58 TaxID=1874112 RepID=UPI000D6DDD7E|nr:hypothetical protein [Aquimarina sp. AU58]